jgi:hypothetical protein
MFHAESKNLRSKLQNKQTEIVTQISVLKEKIVQLSKIEESNFKKKLYSLKISESKTSITCNTNDCQKKLDDMKKWGNNIRDVTKMYQISERNTSMEKNVGFLHAHIKQWKPIFSCRHFIT